MSLEVIFLLFRLDTLTTSPIFFSQAVFPFCKTFVPGFRVVLNLSIWTLGSSAPLHAISLFFGLRRSTFPILWRLQSLHLLSDILCNSWVSMWYDVNTGQWLSIIPSELVQWSSLSLDLSPKVHTNPPDNDPFLSLRRLSRWHSFIKMWSQLKASSLPLPTSLEVHLDTLVSKVINIGLRFPSSASYFPT